MYFLISNIYYKEYMSEYYKKNKEIITQRNLNYYYNNKQKIREKQNIYFKKYYRKIITPSKILYSNPPDVNTTQNLTVTF